MNKVSVKQQSLYSAIRVEVVLDQNLELYSLDILDDNPPIPNRTEPLSTDTWSRTEVLDAHVCSVMQRQRRRAATGPNK